MLYNPPTGGAANDPYVGKNLAAGQQGSKVPPAAVETTQRELVNVIVASGQTPTNSDVTQVLKAIRSGVLEFYPDTGTADALIVTPQPIFAAVPDGAVFTVFKGPAANATTTPSLAVNGISQPIVKHDGSTLAAGDLPASSIFTVLSLGGRFYVVGLRKSDATTAAPVHIGTDTGPDGTHIVLTAVSGAIPSNPDGHIFVIAAAHACGGPNTAVVPGLNNGNPVAVLRNDGTPLEAGDWVAGERIECLTAVVAGTPQLRLVRLTIKELQEALVTVFTAKPDSSSIVTYMLAANQAVSRSVYTVIGVTGSDPAFGAMSGGIFTVSKTGLYLICGTLVTTATVPSGEVEYAVGYVYKNNAQLTSSQSNNTSFGSSSAGISVTAFGYFNTGDTINLAVFQHSSNADDTAITVIGSGATSLAIAKLA